MKRAARIGIILLVALVLLGVGARWYLTSHLLTRKVNTQLAEIYGGEVVVEGVDVWVANSSLNGLKLFEKDKSVHAEPWLFVEHLQADLSVFDLMSGDFDAGQVKLKGAKLLLRFDENGKLLTELPDQLFATKGSGPSQVGTLPQVTLENSQITIRKEGKDFALNNINAELTKVNDRYVLTGSVEGSGWGKWTLGGNATPGSPEIIAVLSSQGPVPVTQPMLNQIPYIPRSVWQAVQIERGDTTGKLDFKYNLANNEFHYRVELDPRNTDFTVDDIELKATQASGKVVIDNGLVQLRDVVGNVFDGTLRTDADLDFRTDITALRFSKIEAPRGIGPKVEKFPPSWRFPPRREDGTPKITGSLEGSVAIAVRFYPEANGKTRVDTEGEGKLRVVNAKVGGFKANKLEVQLQAIPGSFRFGVPDEEARGLPSIGVLQTLLVSYTTLLAPPDLSAGVLADTAQPRGVLVGEKEKDKEGPKADKEKTSYFTIDLSMKDLDLQEFAKNLEFKLPFNLVGKASFEVKVSIPLDNAGDLKLYKVRGKVELRDFLLGDLKLDQLEGDLEFKEGFLTLHHLKGRMPADPVLKDRSAGTFLGQATFQVEPLGDLKANLALDRVPLSQVAKLSGLVEPLEGEISGKLSALVPGKDMKNPKTWSADGQLSSARVRALGWNLDNASATIRLDKGTLEVSKVQAMLEGAAIRADASMVLEGAFPFKGQLNLENADLSAIQRLAPEWRPPVKVSGQLQTIVDVDGTANPLKVHATGNTQATDLQIEKFAFKDIKVGWELQPDRLEVKGLRAELYEGEITGSGSIPFDPKARGNVELQVKNLDAGALAKSIPAMPFKLQGKVDGNLKGSLPAVEPGKERAVSVQVDLSAPKLRVQNIPTEKLQGSVDYKSGVVDYRLQGKSLGGTFELKGQVPPAEEKKDEARKGLLRITNIQIPRLFDALGAGDTARFYQGTVSLEFNFTHSPGEAWPEGTGRLRLSNVRIRDYLLVTDATADVVLANEQVRLKEFSTTFGEGLVRAQANFNLRRPDQSWFTISMDRVETAQLLSPWLGDTLKGAMNARIRGKLGSEWTGSADIELPRATFAGLSVTQWRLPLTFRYAPSFGHGEIIAHETSAQVGPGRMTGKVSIGWDHTFRVEGNLRFFRISVENLLKETIGSSSAAGGLLTGRFDFNGRDMRSINDLTGKLDASFEQSQAMNVPVLKQVSPFLGINPSTTFQKGALHARLANGFFRIQALGLEGNNVSLFAQGSVSLAGRIDLDVQATTANFGIDPRLRFLGLRIPAAGPVPLLIAQEAATLLSNRVVHLRVTGTVRSPNIRVLPLASITQEGVRYFLTRTFGPLPFNP